MIFKRFAALSDPTRLELFHLIHHYKGSLDVAGLRDAYEDATGHKIAQPTVSHHLNILYDALVIDRVVRGVHHYYRVNADIIVEMQRYLDAYARMEVRL